MFIIVITLFLTMIYFLLSAVMNGFASREKAMLESRPARYQDERGQFPAPQLQPAPAQDLRVLRAEDEKKLNATGWVDPKAKVARIPDPGPRP